MFRCGSHCSAIQELRARPAYFLFPGTAAVQYVLCCVHTPKEELEPSEQNHTQTTPRHVATVIRIKPETPTIQADLVIQTWMFMAGWDMISLALFKGQDGFDWAEGTVNQTTCKVLA